MDIPFLFRIGSDKIYFLVVHLTDGHIVSPAEQFKVNDVLDDVSGIHVPETQQIVAQTDVHNIIFAQGA